MTQHNFGYETLGTTYTSTIIENVIYGSVFTITEDASAADSIKVGLAKSAAFGWTGKVKCAIYKHSDLSRVGVTEERTLTLTNTFTWYTFNFNAPKPSLVINTPYILVVWSENVTGYSYVCGDNGDTNQCHYQAITYDGFPDPLVPTHMSRKYSIYCTYTVGGAPPAGGVLAQVM
jgi:hypothetical protein